jgi:MGT family glycosyltransferase
VGGDKVNVAKTIFFNIPAQGHINPALPVIRELVQRGEEVICINSEETRAAHESTNARFEAYPFIPTMQGLMNNASGGNLADNALELVKIAEQIMAWVLELLEREKPDYMIFDSLCSWAKQASDKLGIKAAGSISTFVLAPGALPPVPISSMLSMVGSIIPRMPAYWQAAGRMRRKFGVKGVGLAGALSNMGALNIVYTSALFQPGGNKLGTSFKFVGPSLAPRASDNDFPFEAITRKPMVYISLGTINNDNLDFYRQCFEAFGNYDAQFILSVGKRTNIQALESIPANFIVRNFVPQLEVLQRSDLFITHGGMNSVHEGLYYNVPLVVIPQQFEQSIVAQQVVKHGAGVALADKPPFGRVTATDLRTAVDQVMKARAQYHEAAVLLGESLRVAGGYQRAADELIAFGREK